MGRLLLREQTFPDQKWTLLEDYVVDRFDLSPEWISKRAQNAQLSAVTQNQPVRVEIKGFKTGRYLGVKTALVGPITAGPEGHVECPESDLQTTIYSLADRGCSQLSTH
jgi:hypothetical protein